MKQHYSTHSSSTVGIIPQYYSETFGGMYYSPVILMPPLPSNQGYSLWMVPVTLQPIAGSLYSAPAQYSNWWETTPQVIPNPQPDPYYNGICPSQVMNHCHLPERAQTPALVIDRANIILKGDSSMAKLQVNNQSAALAQPPMSCQVKGLRRSKIFMREVWSNQLLFYYRHHCRRLSFTLI